MCAENCVSGVCGVLSDVWSCVMCSLSIGLSLVWTVQQLSCSGVTGLCVCVLVCSWFSC